MDYALSHGAAKLTKDGILPSKLFPPSYPDKREIGIEPKKIIRLHDFKNDPGRNQPYRQGAAVHQKRSINLRQW